jgi:hypothetical protein
LLTRKYRCSPNAALSWNSESMTMSIYARRKIKADEEVTIAYIDILDSHAERQRKLQLVHGFACACERCGLTSRALTQSDENRKRLREWVSNHVSFEDWLLQTAEEKNTSKLQAYHAELMELFPIFSAEGLTVFLASMMDMSDLMLRMTISFGRKSKVKARLDATKKIWGWSSTHSAAVRQRIDEYEQWGKNVSEAPLWGVRPLDDPLFST